MTLLGTAASREQLMTLRGPAASRERWLTLWVTVTSRVVQRSLLRGQAAGRGRQWEPSCVQACCKDLQKLGLGTWRRGRKTKRRRRTRTVRPGRSWSRQRAGNGGTARRNQLLPPATEHRPVTRVQLWYWLGYRLDWV